MRFSDQFKIRRSSADTWFDPILSVDTQLFIDPFLIYASEDGLFRGSHAEIIRFFNNTFRLVAASKGNRASIRYRKAVSDLAFPEVEELCLGYSVGTTKGLGSGRALAEIIAAALWEAVEAGLTEVDHFEEVTILREGIGADRISDTTACLLRRRLAVYTSRICSRHNVPTRRVRYRRGTYDSQTGRWIPIEAHLPFNRYNGKPILLVPNKYLRDLPTISAEDFWDFCYTYENETLRDEYSYDVTRSVPKHDIIELAKNHPEFLEAYMTNVEHRRAKPYNLKKDKKGVIRWYDATATHCRANARSFDIISNASFFEIVAAMIDEFQHYVERNAGWRLLWNDGGTSKGEKASQLLLLGIIKHYCRANDIDISPEANIGRGPVDFKVSQGYRLRALIEVKLARNTRYWHGITNQLPEYLKAERIKCGYFLVVILSDADERRAMRIERKVSQLAKSMTYKIDIVKVDARHDKRSASRM